jgi:hypothetical protein
MKETEITLEAQLSKFQKLKAEWEVAKENTVYPFAEYTDSLITTVEEIIQTEEPFGNDLKIFKIFSNNMELENIHIPGGVTIGYILGCCSRDARIENFIKYNNHLDDEDYWKRLSDAYQNQDYNPVPYSTLKKLFTSDRKGSENLMNPEERVFFQSLPEEIEIYRAMSMEELKREEFRFSWTLDKKVAEKFKKRNEMLYKTDQLVHNMTVSKKDVLAYLNEREENEIIYLHNCS